METPPPLPAMTVEQAADLRCLGLALFAAEVLNGKAPPMVRVYLDRLRKSDPSRDWKAIAPTFSADMSYGDFMGEMNTCHDRIGPARSRRRPPGE